MTYKKRLSLLIIVDSLIVISSIYVSFWLLNPSTSIFSSKTLLLSSLSLIIWHHLFAYTYKLYHKAWEYASVGEIITILKAVTYSVAVTGFVQLLAVGHIYIRALLITWMLHMILIGGSRFSWRVYRDIYFKPRSNKKRTLIIGAGAAGSMVARQLLQNKEAELFPVAFVDDDEKKHKLQVYDIPVMGSVADIEKTVEKMKIDNIIIAIPSLGKKEINTIYQECVKTDAKTKIIPMLEDLMSGKVSVNEVRDVEVEDLLGRDPVKLDMNSISESITGKTVLVTGAGGSIGSEICRQIANFTPKELILLGHGENSIYSIELELKADFADQIIIHTEIADIQDRDKIFLIMEKYMPHVVYHAAAHKHVPLMERNPEEAVKNNIFGTKNVADAADTFSVGTFVLVSSDKAVNPTNVMGATKRFAEMVIQELAQLSKTKFVAVRFGNVLGSRGSVIPLFKKQIQAGGPVTVTHPDMTRYFMTIPEASRLVIQAGTLARGGEIFVLDMGEPVKIVDLAKNLITLSGYTIEEIGIKFSGIRPGEKMYEELLNENEIHKADIFPKIHIGKATVKEREILNIFLLNFKNMNELDLRKYLLEVANNNEPEIKELFKKRINV
ncbi:polysaccharide biosynthesis protein [Sutcliffiella rhizosphaerae]|uniref:UDP-N-acetyl-alpha-D-glucosamine C6 dehydratase n=1 Tax=Sutcliffiella rhizosphaerae TaxID=2880967 RepID=A0ABN8A8E4_9BACI|nr:nucleoside-diphosphate sugar epimerase/dehydratase [Sutcliffiella rhizosphaerae]CAG9620192.1 UDP-N-acetyl-alpha-D-glucosamine C6 dehydratase [Sutcliffiella rhizosphaerae]